MGDLIMNTCNNLNEDNMMKSTISDWGKRVPVRHLRKPTDPSVLSNDQVQIDSRALLSSPLARAFMTHTSTAQGVSLELVGALLKFIETAASFEVQPAELEVVGALLGLTEDSTGDDGNKNRLTMAEVSAAAEARTEKLLSGLSSVVKEFKESGERYERFKWLRWFARQSFSLDDFMQVRVVGRGAFGHVYATKFRELGETVAIKTMDRRAVKGRRLRSVVTNEELALKRLAQKPSPFVMHLLWSFVDAENYYLCMPLAIGGDQCFAKKRARLYAAEIALGLGHMHAMRIVYRDMKPANVLIDSDGHCMISDLGLALILKDGQSKIKGRAGTPQYMAPEVRRGGDNTYEPFSPDWFGFGVCVLEMLTGKRVDLEKLEKKDNDWTLPKPPDGTKLDKSARKIVKALLRNDPEDRLGSPTRGGFAALMHHAYFDKISWRKTQLAEAKPVWKPRPGEIYVESHDMIEASNKDKKWADVKITEEELAQCELKFTNSASIAYNIALAF